MRRLLVCLVLAPCLALGGPVSARASAPPPATPTGATGALAGDDARIVRSAETAWNRGRWTQVRALLEPLINEEGRLANPELRRKALIYLADATLQDDAITQGARESLAAGYLTQVIEASPRNRIPAGIYSAELYALDEQIRANREQAEADQCVVDRNACLADLEESKTQRAQLQTDYDALKKAYGEQVVEVRERTARNRGVALIPFGVGHFYNDQVALGATFLSLEVAFGAAGLGLLIQRSLNCRRTNGRQPESLVCTGDASDKERVENLRRAEEAMGWFFLGTVALDIVLSQVLFKPFQTTSVQQKTRNELERESRDAKDPGPPKKAKRGKKQKKKARAKVRPTPAIVPGGGGLGLDVRF